MTRYQSRYGFRLIEDFPEIPSLPDPFTGPQGTRISSPAQWLVHREYLLDMLDYFLYGPMPPVPAKVSGRILESGEYYGGAALEEHILIDCGDFQFKARLLRPNKEGKFPVICAYLMPPFMGQLPAEWETLCQRDYALALINMDAIAPDRPEGGGPLYQAYPDYQGKAIAAWSWGIMRLIDYLIQRPCIDSEKIIATGCSRLGKQTICTMIHDQRIALAGIAGSGCGGFGSFRILGNSRGPEQNSRITETAGRMVCTFPHWFSENMLPFCSIQPPYQVNHEYRLPFDMHFARALCAPRCVITTNALDDTWGNLYGDYGTYLGAQECYRFLGAEENTAYFYRPGPHGYHRSEWLAMLDFADLRLRGLSRPGLSLLNRGIFSAGTEAFFNWRRPSP
jgi:hypothetical protein